MPRIAFDRLPPHARIWIFPSDRPLSADAESGLLETVDAFLESWAAHGTPLTGGRDWREGRFLIVGVDETTAPPSGCSIDSMVNELKKVGSELQVDFLDRAPIWYRAEGDLRHACRPEFKRLVQDGKVTLQTPVFDHAITRKAQLDGGEWERPAGTSWHRRAFFPDREGEG
jgi:hypothetical protein